MLEAVPRPSPSRESQDKHDKKLQVVVHFEDLETERQ